MLHRLVEVVRFIDGNPVRQPNAAQHAGPLTRDQSVARHCQGRDAHPKRFAGCGAASKREGVEDEVNLTVAAQVLFTWDRTHQCDPSYVNSSFFEARSQLLS